jgi:hypothetical protein
MFVYTELAEDNIDAIFPTFVWSTNVTRVWAEAFAIVWFEVFVEARYDGIDVIPLDTAKVPVTVLFPFDSNPLWISI